MNLHVFDSKDALGRAAAAAAARVLLQAIASSGRARVIAATGNSQLEMIAALATQPGIDWNAVEFFHMDEYVGLLEHHPASFRRWIQTRIAEPLQPRAVQYLKGDAPNLDAECLRYSALLHAAPVHLAFVGFGENGHIAFNDPHAADFADPLTVKRVTLDAPCRWQQVGEGHFPDLASVPTEALTVTCPGLFRAQNWICCVPDARKAQAVREALEGPITAQCPASLVRNHPAASVFLDTHSAALLKQTGF